MRITIPHAIESTDQDDYQTDSSSDLYSITPVKHLEIGASRSGSKVYNETLSDAELVEITLDDGSRWFLGPEEREELLNRQGGSSRGIGDGSLILDDSLFSDRESRGFITDAIKRVRVLLFEGVPDLAGKAIDYAREQFGEQPLDELRGRFVDPIAYSIARSIEKKIATQGISRLCHFAFENGGISLKPLTTAELAVIMDVNSDEPTLLLLHGTLSSTQGSFGDLWTSRLQDFERIQSYYGNRIIALEHCTLTESPVANAIQVAELLPKHARLHLLSHSRGGLVGELLCRGTRTEENAFSSDEIAMFDAQQQQRIQLSGLSSKASDALRSHFEEESKNLKILDDMLNEREIHIERFVRVGCPARGTTLASGKLHRWSNRAFNAIGLLGGQKLNPVYRAFEEFTLGILNSNTKPDVLPGLQAQMPGSALIHVLNNEPGSIPADLSIVAGDLDIERRLNWKRIPVWVSDRFFGGANDLVVNTASMDGGANRDNGVRSLRVVGDHVNHFSYFGNADSARQLVNRLVDDATTRFEVIQRPNEVYIPRSAKPVHTGNRPVLLLVPGLLGSELDVDGKSVWLDLPALVRGHITRLSTGNTEHRVSPTQVLDRAYGDFIRHFSAHYDVHVCPYDWRLSLSVGAQSLADKLEQIFAAQEENSRIQPVRIVAHSMGGLVVRRLMADHTDIWNGVVSRAGSRFIMAGTPNNGSYSINRILAGELQLIKLLALADLKNNKRQIMDMVARFPGLASLLPGFGELEWLQEDTWKTLSTSPGADAWSPIDEEQLSRVRRERQKILETQLDPDIVSYVAGQSRSTVVDAHYDMHRGGQLCFRYTREGDGQVGWDDGIPQGLSSVWYQPSVHGSLLSDHDHFTAWEELLDKGQTSRLPKARPALDKRGSQGVDLAHDADADVIDYLPDSRTLAELAMGMDTSISKRHRSADHESLTVTIVHGDLRFSRYPVAVGHYDGDSILHAEKILDKELDHRLSERQSTGQYPGPVGTSEVVFKRSERDLPEGALVVGLGKLGELSTAKLERTLTSGFVKYIFECNDWWSARKLDGQGADLGLSVLLIGSGLGSMNVYDSVGAILKAASKANDIFKQKRIDDFRLLGKLEIVELYQDLALQAAEDANSWSPHIKGLEIKTQVVSRDGGRRRSRFSASKDWWHTIAVKASDSGNEYIYDDFTRFARNQLSREPVSRVFVDHFIEQIMNDTHYDPNNEASEQEALFQLLFPQTLKESTPDSDKLLLSLDEETARIPWEMLIDGWSAEKKPLAISKMLIRRLSLQSQALRPEPSRLNNALVVGDPPSGSDGYPMLPGAVAEAHEVVRQLEINNRFDVTRCISDKDTDRNSNAIAMDVVRHLYSQEFRILHLAGHGSYYRSTDQRSEQKDEEEGMVLGEGLRLTPSLVRKLPRAPAVVFLNCCHLGHVERRDSQPRVRYNYIAANLATQFIDLGTQVVIAAGWEVNDGAAQRFAEVFYDALLLNKPLAQCVHEARLVTYNQFRQYNTFGAYQCWGDPEFRLNPRDQSTGSRHGDACFMSAHECEMEAVNIHNAAFTAREKSRKHLLRKADQLLRHVVEHYGDPWKTPVTRQSEWNVERTAVLAKLGLAYGELGALAIAVGLLRIATTLNPSALSANDLEQLGNFEVRHAIHPGARGQLNTIASMPDPGSTWSILKRGQKRLGQLLSQYSESSSGVSLRHIHCLMGSGAKREALYVAHAQKTVSRILACLKSMQHFYGMGWSGETEDIHIDQSMDEYIRQAALNEELPDKYAFVNFSLAYLINRWHEPVPIEPLPTAFVELVAQFTRAVMNSDDRNDSFWTATTEADVMMLQLLDPELRQRVNLYDAEINLPKQIQHMYITADKRFGSVRQWSSAYDHMAFIETMITNKPLFSKKGTTKAKPALRYDKLLELKGSGKKLDDTQLLLIDVGGIKQTISELRHN